MPARRTITLGAVAAVVVVGGGVAAVTALDDPDGSVEAVSVSDASPVDPASPAPQDGTTQRVPGLDELRGTVGLDDDRDDDGDGDDSRDDEGEADDVVDELEVNGVDLDFGPDDWVASAGQTADLDGDGTIEALRDELAGLVGNEVTFMVRFDDDGDDADVYVVDGVTYRDVSSPAPWLPPDAASDEALRAAAATAVGPGADVIELDPDDEDDVAWEAEVRAADGTLHEVHLDAAGTVIDVRADD